MVKTIHFISGLPRSGSTLLCALLKQNPRFSAGMTSPLAMLTGAIQTKMSGGEFGTFFDDEKRARIMRGIFDSYYEFRENDEIIFDTNRTWTGRASLLQALYPNSKMICCVRDVAWIIDSVEKMLAKNPLPLSRMFNFKVGGSVYSRVDTLMNPEHGFIGLSWNNLRGAWFGDFAKHLLIVPYDHLTKQPKKTLQRLYEALEEPQFSHDLNNVAYDEPDYDLAIGMPGLHKIRSKVEFQERQPCIPPDIFAKYASTNFWDREELNTRKVTIL